MQAAELRATAEAGADAVRLRELPRTRSWARRFWALGTSRLPRRILLYGFFPSRSPSVQWLRCLVAKRQHLPHLLSIESAGAPVGIICYSIQNEQLELSWIFLRHAASNRGLGRKAMLALEKYARARARGIVLSVDSRNSAALHLYRSMGYREVERPTHYWFYHAKAPPAVLPLLVGNIFGAVPLRSLSPLRTGPRATVISGGVCRLGVLSEERLDLESLGSQVGCSRFVFSLSGGMPPPKGALALGTVLRMEKILEKPA